MQTGDYDSAISLFEIMGDYKQSEELTTEARYQQAKQLLAEGQYQQAARALYNLQDYKDSSVLLEPLRPLLLLDAEPGSYITFGCYEQDNNLENSSESIEWLVLETDGNNRFLLASYILDVRPYDTKNENTTWANCTLRPWLNKTFFDTAFSLYEQTLIQTTNVMTPNNPKYNTDGGEPTQDKVFLLSIQEVEQYLGQGILSIKTSPGIPTAYALASPRTLEQKDGYATWWLRSTGYDSHKTATMYTVGSVNKLGNSPDSSPYPGVRPAMWINTDAEWLQTLAQTGELPPDIS